MSELPKWSLEIVKGSGEQSACSGMTDLADKICVEQTKKWLAAAEGAMGKAVEDLTEDERFSVAWMAGVRIETGLDGIVDGRMAMTTEPCCIVARGDGG